MTETRFKDSLRHGYEQERTERMLSALNMLRVRKESAARGFVEDMALSSGIYASLSKRESVSFILPAFPFKSPNIERKCIGALPDKAEEIAVQNLIETGVRMHSVARTRIIIALDGFAYSDIVGIPSATVAAYASAIAALQPKPEIVEWFGLAKSIAEGERLPEILDARYAPPLEEIRARIHDDPSTARHYAGLKSFWKKDASHSGSLLSSKELSRQAGEIAVRMMARNIAYSKYLTDNFPEAIRLSIHASHGRTGRFHVNLLPDTHDTSGGSPWHGVALKTADGKWRVIRREQAERERYALMYENGRPSYYAEEKSAVETL